MHYHRNIKSTSKILILILQDKIIWIKNLNDYTSELPENKQENLLLPWLLIYENIIKNSSY